MDVALLALDADDIAQHSCLAIYLDALFEEVLLQTRASRHTYQLMIRPET